MSDVVDINVGGVMFTTTIATLTQQPGSMLAVMFSPDCRFGTSRDAAGRPFIDRDGALFSHILAYLREGDFWEPPTDPSLVRRVLREFDYFALEHPFRLAAAAGASGSSATSAKQRSQAPPRAGGTGVSRLTDVRAWDALDGAAQQGDEEEDEEDEEEEGERQRRQRRRRRQRQAALVIMAAGGVGMPHLIEPEAHIIETRNQPAAPPLPQPNAAAAAGWRQRVFGSTATARQAYAAAAALDGHFYLIGGQDMNGNILADVDRCECVNSLEAGIRASWRWQRGAPMLGPRAGHAAAACDGHVYAIGGKGPGNVMRSSVEKYDPQVRMWLQAPALPQARDALAAAVLDGCIYALGGKFSPLNRAVAGAPNGLVLDTVDRLDPREPSWQSLRPMLTPRAGLAATVLDGRLLALGGIGTDGQVLSSTECYEPRMNQWAPFQPLLQPRYGLQAVTLSPGGPDERVMVMGGMTSNNFNDGEEANAGPVALRRVSRGAALSSTEAWDSDSGSWRLNDAHMHQPRFWFAAAAMEVTVPPR